MDAVEVGECCSLPCYLTNGQNVSVTVVFTAGKSNLCFHTKISHHFSISRRLLPGRFGAETLRTVVWFVY